MEGVKYVTLKTASGGIKVNPAMVGSVYADPDRENRVLVAVAGVLHRVPGVENEILSLLNWKPSVPHKPADNSAKKSTDPPVPDKPTDNSAKKPTDPPASSKEKPSGGKGPADRL